MAIQDKPIRVLIADDHEMVREGLAAILSDQAGIEIVTKVATAQQAVEQWFACRPNVGLIDLRLGPDSGADVIRAICARQPDAALIVLSTYNTEEDVYTAMHAGARAYVLKDCDRAELIRCILSVSEGREYLSPSVAGSLVRRMRDEQLTPRELDVLQKMAEGLSNKLIADRLSVTEGTVKIHVKNILGKMNADTRTEAVTLAVKRGLVRL